MSPTRSGRRLRVECLEDRLAPATFAVTTARDVVDAADGRLSLREAITRANARPGSDTITLPAGTFRIALDGANENLNATGDFDVTDTLTVRGTGAGLTVIDAQQKDRVLDATGPIPGAVRLILQNLTVRNGNVTGEGGGVQLRTADLVVRDCAVTGNLASGSGGGISNIVSGFEPGKVTLARTTVSGNTAGDLGGGVAAGDSTVLGVNDALTLTDAVIRRNVAQSNGGGIFALSTANLTGCTVSANSSVTGSGGGVAAGTANLTNCAVTGNDAFALGGGIVARAATATTCLISGNSATADGGGIWVLEKADLTNCTVSGNSATADGGGVHLGIPNGGGGTITLRACTVTGNSAGGAGGGVRCISSGPNNSGVTLVNSTVSGNTAGGDAGGIAANNVVNLTNSTVSGNSAGGDGGGIFASSANLMNCTVSGNRSAGDGGGISAGGATLVSCTVVKNSARTGGGVFHIIGTVRLRGTIVALNLTDPAGQAPDISGVFISDGHNLIGNGDGGTGFTNGVVGDRVGTATAPINPRLGPLANNGGRTKTHALLPGSPAIDRGDNANNTPADQRGTGFARKKDGNGDGRAVADIGAFEL